MTYPNSALQDICDNLALWELTDEQITALASDLAEEMKQFAKCDDCGCRSNRIDEAGQCAECHDKWATKQMRYWKPLYDGEVLAGLHKRGDQ